MQSKTLKRFLVLLLCAIFTFSTSATVYGASVSSLREKKSRIQSEIDEAEAKLDKLRAKKQKTQEYLGILYNKVDLLKDKIGNLQADADAIQANIDKLQSEIDDIEAELEETQRKIDEKQKAFDVTYNEYCQRLRAMYISGNVTNLEVLLTSSDLSSILTRSQMIKSVSEQDSDTLDLLMKQMEEIEKSKADLEENRIKLDSKKKEHEADKKKLDDNIAEVKSAKAELDSEVAECNELMAKINNSSAEIREAISESEEEKRQVEADIQSAISSAGSYGTGSISGSTGSGGGSGQLSYPTAYTGISAGFPRYSSGGYHSGVDFPCPSGTTVSAAASGTVIVALNLNYSYGHYIVIDHGNGLSTLYAHNTTLYVSVGQHVSKGQAIAASGSTGNSTGPHCHFEVRVNGSAVNPMNYL